MNYLLGILLQNPFAVFAFWILAFVSILGVSLELRARYGLDPAPSLLAASLGVLNVLYWGTYVNFHLTQIVLIGVGMCALVMRRDWLEKNKVTYLTLMVLVLWFAGMSVNTVPFSWDEFFWTLFDQHIASYSRYWSTQSGILITHIRYMPGAALWHNFFGIKGHYNEATAYFAISVLFLVIFYWLASQVLKINRTFLLIAMVLTLGCFSEGWFLLYVDPFVGLMMALALITGIRYFQGDKSSFPLLILSLTGSILFKETGVIPMLAVMAALVIASFTPARKDVDWMRLGGGLAYCLAVVVAWRYYLNSVGASNPVQWQLFADNSPEALRFRAGILEEFSKYIATSYTMLAIWGLCFLVLKSLKQTTANRMSVLFFIFTVLGFVAVHLIAWLYLVGDGLVGSTRYMGSLLLALFIFYGVYQAGRRVLKLPSKLILLAFLAWPPVNLLWLGIKPSALFMLLTPHPKQVPIAREKLARLKEIVPPKLLTICREQPTKVWFVHQNSDGYEAMLARHLMTPCQVAPGFFSLGEPYFKGDIWTQNYNDAQFLDVARQYPYMVIANVDANFVDKYGHLFSSAPQVGVMYKYDVALKGFRAQE